MSIPYSVIEIFSGEDTRYRRQPAADAVVEMVRSKKIAARCLVTKGTAGCYENGEIVTQRIVGLSFNMPVKIEIVLPAAERDDVLAGVAEIIPEGIIGYRDLSVYRHQTKNRLIPRHFMVRDAMTSRPDKVFERSSLGEVMRLLLPAFYTGLPVINDEHVPVGMITHGDLVSRAGVPIRLGLLKKTGEKNLESIIQTLGARTAAEIMSCPVITVPESKPLTAAVEIMLDKNVKRLPVVNDEDRLTGMLSRFDIFRIISTETPHWRSCGYPDVCIVDQKNVSDIMDREVITVTPDTAVDRLIRIIDTDEIQRIAVVDDRNKFLGLISDGDLLTFFLGRQPGVTQHFSALLSGAGRKGFGRLPTENLHRKTAADLMRTDLITVTETTAIEDAIRTMTKKGLKRLPVIDDTGRFKGMISREALLRTGYRRIP